MKKLKAVFTLLFAVLLSFQAFTVSAVDMLPVDLEDLEENPIVGDLTRGDIFSGYISASSTFSKSDSLYSYNDGNANIGFKARNLVCSTTSATLVVKLQYYKPGLFFPTQVTAGSCDMSSRINAGSAFYGYSWNCSDRLTSSPGSIDEYGILWTYTIGSNNGNKIYNNNGDWIKYTA